MFHRWKRKQASKRGPALQVQIQEAVEQLQLQQITGIFNVIFSEDGLLSQTALGTKDLDPLLAKKDEVLRLVNAFIDHKGGYDYRSILQDQDFAEIITPSNLISIFTKILLQSTTLQQHIRIAKLLPDSSLQSFVKQLQWVKVKPADFYKAIDGLAISGDVHENILAFCFYQLLHFWCKLREQSSINQMNPHKLGVIFSNAMMTLMGVEIDEPADLITLYPKFNALIRSLLWDAQYQPSFYEAHSASGKRILEYLEEEKFTVADFGVPSGKLGKADVTVADDASKKTEARGTEGGARLAVTNLFSLRRDGCVKNDGGRVLRPASRSRSF